MKVLILDRDVEYVKRLEFYLGQYAAEMQILNFDSAEKMRSYMDQKDFDVVLCGETDVINSIEELEIPVAGIPFAWLSKKNERVNNEQTIFKYQSVKLIYEQLCDLYESVYRNKVNRHNDSEGMQEKRSETAVITFFPVHGGAGSSVMALSCAQKFSESSNVLYLNLEEFSSEGYLKAENSRTFSDIIAELKGKYSDESLEKVIESVRCNDENINSDRLYFIKGCRNAVDISFITSKMIEKLISVLRSSGNYDYIIIDASMVLSEMTASLIRESDKLVFTTDASEDSEQKLKKVQRYVQLTERESEKKAEQFLIYNKYYSDASLAEYTKGMVVIGSFGRYRLQDNRQISRQTVINNIIRTPKLFERLW